MRIKFIQKFIDVLRGKTSLFKGSETINHILSELLKLEKMKTLMKDDIYKIYYRDEIINFYLPNAFNDAVQTPILMNDTFFEIENLEKIKKYINQNSNVIDAGANIGNHTIYFSKICKAQRVYSFEPQKVVFEILKKNTEINELKNTTIHNCALSKSSGNAKLNNSYIGNLGGASFTNSDDGEYKTISLDEINFEKLDFIKIDVEGHQLDLLLGAKNTLLKHKPILWIEMLYSKVYTHCNDLEENIKPKKLLEEYGYVLKEKTHRY